MRATILVALVALAGVAQADDKATAEKYFRAGAKAYAAQNFEAAIANFEEAFHALPVPEIAFSAAQAYRRQYRVDPRPEYVKRSVELYRLYLDKVKTGGRVGDAADSLGEMQRELDRLGAAGIKAELHLVERTRLGVTIAVDAKAADTSLREIGDAVGDALPGVTATLDGKPLEPFALVDVAPGEHVVTVTAPGYEPIEQKHRAVAGASELIDIALRAKPARVELRTEPGTRVIVDGRPAGAMPMGALELVAGKHVITLLHDGRRAAAREIVVERGQTTVVAAPLQRTGQRRAVPWVYAGAGALAVGAVAGLAVALVADGDASNLRAEIAAGNRPASDADAYERKVARRDHAATATYVLGGAAVLAAVIGTGLYWFDAPSAEGVTVTPVASPDGAAVVVGGTF